MYLLVVTLPLLSFLLLSTLGFFLGKKGGLFLSLMLMFFSLVISLYVFFEVCLCNMMTSVNVYSLFNISVYSINIGFIFDPLVSSMLLMVNIVSFFVHVYSVDYMSHDKHMIRFISYLSLFTFFMMILISSDNFLQLFMGWEGVGICSYLLINFWYSSMLANKAALKALFVNSVSDVIFFFGICYVFLLFKSVDYYFMFNMIKEYEYSYTYIMGFELDPMFFLSFCVFFAACGKSAQLGLHMWLPDAMEGPTPVSALLHAATMVTAGVFLLLKCCFLLNYSSFIMQLITFFGMMTSLYFAMVGLYQYDMKKMIAYSTCSQLGYMFFTVGCYNYNMALFHLINHAFFKALLFLGAGAVMHSLMDEQDMRSMGGLMTNVPFIYVCLLVGNLAMTGFPFLTAFFSKELLMESSLINMYMDSSFLYMLAMTTAFFTAAYSSKLYIYVFLVNNIYSKYVPSEVGMYMYSSLLFLCILSIFGGYLLSDFFVGFGSGGVTESLYVFNGDTLYLYEVHFLPFFMKMMPLFVSLLALVGFFYMHYLLIIFIENVSMYYKYVNYYKFILTFNNTLNKYFYYAGYMNNLYNDVLISLMKMSYGVNTKIMDKGFLEMMGPYGVYLSMRKLSSFFLFFGNKLHITLFMFVLYFFFSFAVYLYMLFFSVDLFILFTFVAFFEII